jgi:putative transposase
MYLGLGVNDPARQAAYRALFRGYHEGRDVEEIRTCLQSGTPLGNDRFRLEVERMLKVKVGQAKRGRPKKLRLESL